MTEHANADEVTRLRVEVEDLREDVAASGALLDRQSALLTGVANALRGRPPELTHWSHHDLPQLAADLAAYAQHEADAMSDALARADSAEAALTRVRELADEWSRMEERVVVAMLILRALDPASPATRPSPAPADDEGTGTGAAPSEGHSEDRCCDCPWCVR
jgi:hypothetical protein